LNCTGSPLGTFGWGQNHVGDKDYRSKIKKRKGHRPKVQGGGNLKVVSRLSTAYVRRLVSRGKGEVDQGRI